MRIRALRHRSWAQDVERLLSEAFGEPRHDAVPRATPPSNTQPYHFEDFIYARTGRAGPASA